jgi:hypothetical protein
MNTDDSDRFSGASSVFLVLLPASWWLGCRVLGLPGEKETGHEDEED